MDTSTSSNPSVPETENPQDSAGVPGASDGSDFQNTATDEVLRQESTESDLDVEQTGEPIENTGQAVAKADNTAYFWSGGIILLIVIGVVIVMRYLKKEDESLSVATPRSAATVSSKKSASKKPAKKASASKSSSKKSKKTTKRKK